MAKMIFYMVLSAILTTFGSVDDQIFLIGEPRGHIDTYSDGTQVLDGEKYALVWTTNGVEFAGFNSNGTLVDSINSKLIIMLPANKNGRLGLTLVQISDRSFCSGTFSLSLLDTRTKNPNTGEYEFNEGEVSNVREYFVLASGYEYTGNQFDRMELAQSDVSKRYVANGYVEPETIAIPTNSLSSNVSGGQIQNEDWTTHQTQNTNVFNVVNVTYVELTNVVTETIWHNATRYIDATNYIDVVMTNSVDVTNSVVNTITSTNVIDVTRYIDVPVYTTITKTNYFDSVFGSVKKPIQTSKTKKKSNYVALTLFNNKEVGTATIQMGKPNSYRLCKISIKMKISKKTYTDTLYGMIDDDGCMLAYGKEANDRLVFNGKDVWGFIQYKGKIYEIDGMITK